MEVFTYIYGQEYKKKGMKMKSQYHKGGAVEDASPSPTLFVLETDGEMEALKIEAMGEGGVILAECGVLDELGTELAELTEFLLPLK